MPISLPQPLHAVALGVAAILAQPSEAFAQSAGCAALDGSSAPYYFFDPEVTLTPSPLISGEVVNISGALVYHYGGAENGWYVSDPLSGNLGAHGSAPLSPIFTETAVPFSKTFAVPSGGMQSFGLTSSHPYYIYMETVFITCTGNQTPVFVPTGIAQQQAITTSLTRNTRNRFALGGGQPGPSNDLFTSSKGGHDDVSAWASITGRTYWDGYDGSSADLTFGLDRFLGSGTLMGVMIGLNQLSVSDATGAATKSDSAMIGLYAAHGYQGGLLADAYLAWSRVSYDATGTNFDTDRILVGLAFSGNIEQPGGTLRPRASLSALWEDFPATVTAVVAGYTRQVTASVGARFDWNAPIKGSDLVPFVSVDLEYGYAMSTSGASDRHLSPRIGTGITGTFGAGRFSAAVDIGRSASKVSDAGLVLSYTVRF